jgi:hypothetical protein
MMGGEMEEKEMEEEKAQVEAVEVRVLGKRFVSMTAHSEAYATSRIEDELKMNREDE